MYNVYILILGFSVTVEAVFNNVKWPTKSKSNEGFIRKLLVLRLNSDVDIIFFCLQE